MNDPISWILALGGLVAAAAVAAMCVVGLLVWLSGVALRPAEEAWRAADKH